MALESGRRLGPYEILSPVGAGGMGEVYRARDTRLGRDVAVKVLPDAVASQPDRLARFEREAKTVAALSHPNIVVLHSIEEADGIRFLTMELIEGQGLDRIVQPGGLPLPRVLDLAIPLADALVAAHERGVVHRDLKPANVMVTKEGRVKVLDFGLAKLAANDLDPEQTQAAAFTRAQTVNAPFSTAGQVVGTIGYMAPEQIRGESVDARTDLFSLGIIIYELAAGRRPFSGGTHADVSSSILRDVPQPLQALRTDLPGDLYRIINRCLEKDRERRFQTAKDVRNELELVKRTVDSVGSSMSHSGKAPTPSAALDVPSIAVLPFVNRSKDEEDEYFSDGLADELLNVLAKIRGLRVAARTSSYFFKGKNEDLAVIGQKLNVETLLEGSVRKAGNRVRIAVQLVKVSDGYQLWSETYDRTLDDIFALQDDIAQSVVKELRTTLMGEGPTSKASGDAKAAVLEAAKGRGENSEAYRLYLQGRYLVERLTREDVAKAKIYLQRALDLDPEFALAWAEYGRALEFQAGYGWVPLTEGYELARTAVARAIALEPNLVEGHIELGHIQSSYDWDWKGAEASFRRALEIAPNSAAALRAAGGLASALGKSDEAIDLCRRACAQDPLSAAAYTSLAGALRYTGRLDEALATYQKVLELYPQRIIVRFLISIVQVGLGRLDEAVAMADQEPEPFARWCGLAYVQHMAGNPTESELALQELIKGFSEDACYQIAAVYSARNDRDRTFEWLEHAFALRDPGLVTVMAEPVFRNLQSDPRWLPFLQKMRLTE